MRIKQKFILVDEDGSERQISSCIATKLVSYLYKKDFFTCFCCHKIFCSHFLFSGHLKQCYLSSTPIDSNDDDIKLSTLAKIQQKAQFKCLKCKTLFPSEDVLQTHYKTCLIYNCVECNKQFASKGTLKIHSLTKHCEGNQNLIRKHDFTCESCSKEYLESLESIYAYYPKYNKILCRDCKQSTSPSAECLPELIERESPSVHTSLSHSDSDPSIVGRIPDSDFQDPSISANPLSTRRKASKGAKRKTRNLSLSQVLKNANSSCNALLTYESNIDALFENISLDQFKSNYSCSVCESKYRSTRFLKCHYIRSHSLDILLSAPLPHACLHCKSKSASLKQLGYHLYDIHIPHVQEKNISKCRHCTVVSYSKEQKKKHLAWHLTEEDVKCTSCNKVFAGLKKLKTHQVHHKLKLDNSNKGLCVHCGKVVNNLARHTSRSHQKKLCLTCGKLLSESVYQYHKNVLHKNFKDTSVQCSSCGEMQKSYKHYHYHRRMIHEKHLFVHCSTCPRRFPFPSYLKKHSETCRGKKRNQPKADTSSGPNKCDTCGQAFSTENILMKHLRKQHGRVVRRFACHHCPDMFIRNDARIAHERIHTGERPFSCAVCGQRFRQITDCKRHEDRHSGKTLPRPKKVKPNMPADTRGLREVSEDLGYYVEYESKPEKPNFPTK